MSGRPTVCHSDNKCKYVADYQERQIIKKLKQPHITLCKSMFIQASKGKQYGFSKLHIFSAFISHSGICSIILGFVCFYILRTRRRFHLYRQWPQLEVWIEFDMKLGCWSSFSTRKLEGWQTSWLVYGRVGFFWLLQNSSVGK